MKRLLTLLALACVAFGAFGATLNPVQLLNPAGSTSGQAIVSTGASSAPAWGTLAPSNLAVQIPNSLVGNVSSSTQAPGVVGLPSCASNTNALIYTNGAGFTCNTNINASTLGGQTFASPSAIGSGVASTGSFTTLAASGNDALLYQTTNALSVPNAAATTVTTWTKVSDRVNANFNASTGVFTAPATGNYWVAANLTFPAMTGGSGIAQSVRIVGNGVTLAQQQIAVTATTTAPQTVSASALVSLTAGQTIVIQAFQNSGSAVSLAVGSAYNNSVSIARLP